MLHVRGQGNYKNQLIDFIFAEKMVLITTLTDCYDIWWITASTLVHIMELFIYNTWFEAVFRNVSHKQFCVIISMKFTEHSNQLRESDYCNSLKTKLKCLCVLKRVSEVFAGYLLVDVESPVENNQVIVLCPFRCSKVVFLLIASPRKKCQKCQICHLMLSQLNAMKLLSSVMYEVIFIQNLVFPSLVVQYFSCCF